MVKTIAVKFCGNCNPYIDSGELVAELMGLLPSVRFVFSDYEQAELLLMLCGCLSNCAERPDFCGPALVVAGETLNSRFCPAAQLAERIAAEIKDMR